MTTTRFFLITILTVLIISCSTDETNNLPPRDFDAIAVESGFNSITFRWTESTDPENSIVKYNVYIAENIDGSEYQLIAENLSEELVADTNVISVEGENIFIDPPENPEFRFAYVATNLIHNTQWKGKVVAVDQDGKTNESYFYSSTLADNNIPSIMDFNQTIYRFNSNLLFRIQDNDYTSHTIEVYLNNTLYSTFNTSNVIFIEYDLENLTENTSYNGSIIVKDNNGNLSVPYDFTFNTLGDTYIGDLEFSSQEEIDFFGVNNYTHINGNLTINYNGVFTNFNSLNSLESISGNITIIGQLYNLN
jgi:hypothetical protein